MPQSTAAVPSSSPMPVLRGLAWTVGAVMISGVVLAAAGRAPHHRSDPTSAPAKQIASLTARQALPSGSVTAGRGPGGQDSGPHVIQALDWAMHVTHDDAAAQALLAPGVDATTAEQLVSPTADGDSAQCLTIIGRGDGDWSVTMSYRPPTRPAFQVHQSVHTVVLHGRHWISSITPDPAPAVA